MTRTIPMWQRSICGVLALLGVLSVGALLISTVVEARLPGFATLVCNFILAPYGSYTFGHIALKGRSS